MYSILRTIILGPKTPFANKLFANTGVNHDVRLLWPLPLPVTRGQPNPVQMLMPKILGALGILNINNHTLVEGTTKKHTTVQIDHDLIQQFSQPILDDGSMHHLVREDAVRGWNKAYVHLWDDI